MVPDPNSVPRRPDAKRPAWLKTSADCTLDALVVAGAAIMSAQPSPRAASRMALLVYARRAGLLATPPHRDVLAELDDHLTRFQQSPMERRRRLVVTLNLLVGSASAGLVMEAAEQITRAGAPSPDAAERRALRSVRSALALIGPGA